MSGSLPDPPDGDQASISTRHGATAATATPAPARAARRERRHGASERLRGTFASGTAGIPPNGASDEVGGLRRHDLLGVGDGHDRLHGDGVQHEASTARHLAAARHLCRTEHARDVLDVPRVLRIFDPEDRGQHPRLQPGRVDAIHAARRGEAEPAPVEIDPEDTRPTGLGLSDPHGLQRPESPQRRLDRGVVSAGDRRRSTVEHEQPQFVVREEARKDGVARENLPDLGPPRRRPWGGARRRRRGVRRHLPRAFPAATPRGS